jgi:hypothetical protein
MLLPSQEECVIPKPHSEKDSTSGFVSTPYYKKKDSKKHRCRFILTLVVDCMLIGQQQQRQQYESFSTMLTFYSIVSFALLCLVRNAVIGGDPSTIHTTRSSTGNDNKEDDPIHVLIYESIASSSSSSSSSNDNTWDPAEQLLDQINHQGLGGFQGMIFGQNVRYDGFGTKFMTVLPILHSMMNRNPDSLVVITDSRDVLINHRHYHPPGHRQKEATMMFKDDTIAKHFRRAFHDLTVHYPGSIVVSAEAQCCVSALTHVRPGGYFNHMDGTRKAKACASGTASCLWAGDDQATPWKSFMEDLMMDRMTTTRYQRSKGMMQYDDMYLNAGLVVGKVADLIRIIENIDIESTEDDQAVLTDYMYHHPTTVLLDYAQTLFGNNRRETDVWNKEDGCIFDYRNNSSDSRQLIHKITENSPVFIHSPGGFYECHDKLSTMLGLPSKTKTNRRKHLRRKVTECNYARCSEDDGGRLGLFSNLANFLQELRDRNEDEATESSVLSPPPPPIVIVGDTNTTALNVDQPAVDTVAPPPPPIVIVGATNITVPNEDQSAEDTVSSPPPPIVIVGDTNPPNDDQPVEDTVSSPPPPIVIMGDTNPIAPDDTVVTPNVTVIVSEEEEEDMNDSSGLLDLIFSLRNENSDNDGEYTRRFLN